MNLQLSTV